jgi:signal peptidase I
MVDANPRNLPPLAARRAPRSFGVVLPARRSDSTWGVRLLMPRKPLLLSVLAVLVIPTMAALGAFAGGLLPHWTPSARAEADLLGQQVAVQEARMDELRATVASLRTTLSERERTIAQLEDALEHLGPLSAQYAELAATYGALQVEHEELTRELGSLVRIQTPELAGNALLLDKSVKGVKYSGAVCSGSMEPNITCNDLLLMYEPRVTDLRVGDIIYFRRQAPGCNGALEDRFMLHRITKVTAGAEGLRFHTRGDALAGPDACSVPAHDVLYKLLANVRNARIQ